MGYRMLHGWSGRRTGTILIAVHIQPCLVLETMKGVSHMSKIPALQKFKSRVMADLIF